MAMLDIHLSNLAPKWTSAGRLSTLILHLYYFNRNDTHTLITEHKVRRTNTRFRFLSSTFSEDFNGLKKFGICIIELITLL